ncbi:protein MULTIPLE CHLOROPLAST DIVISION SITE 1 [Carica papaya]|uniref:protein MULTIPLE CHLOROPLAST DIVISION SITE 1 n=1 Tax=Carica papaya TaxID=3649 RepID=UPI000B8C83A1|nr:protein MULTIPLE CHLOROPLAST DIVISION SITE 1 [Carica papaya]
MASIWTLQFHSPSSVQPSSLGAKHQISSNAVVFRTEFWCRHDKLNWNRVGIYQKLVSRSIRASLNSDRNQSAQDEVAFEGDPAADSKNLIAKFQGMINSLPPRVCMIKRHVGNNIATGLCIAIALLLVAVRAYMVTKSRKSRPGSVADLVRRGQLRSDRRGISKPLKYEDPFNNPLVKVGKSNSTVEMCGKVYRLAPVTLTQEQQAIHQKRRSRAYQWKRPTVFLKEGDSIPPDVDPDTIRWIPANHPFATTAADIDEDLAQNNVYQKHGVPFRIQAEHEALQRKLEALQNEEKLNNLVIDSRNARDFQRPFKKSPNLDGRVEQKPVNNETESFNPSRSDNPPNLPGSNPSTEEMQKS